MHTIETRTKFIELRAKGHSQRKAAERLGIDRSTALEWDQKHREEIQNGRAYEMEAMQEEFLPAYEEELLAISHELRAINDELRKRDPRVEPTWFLANRQSMLLARMDKLCLKAKFAPSRQNSEPPNQNENPAKTPPESGLNPA